MPSQWFVTAALDAIKFVADNLLDPHYKISTSRAFIESTASLCHAAQPSMQEFNWERARFSMSVIRVYEQLGGFRKLFIPLTDQVGSIRDAGGFYIVCSLLV